MNTNKKISLPTNEILLYILSTATAVTIAWALIFIDGGQTDPLGQGLVIVRGILLGIVSGFATAIVSQKSQRVKLKEAKRWAIGSLGAMLAAELVIVAFTTYATMNPAMQVLWWPLRALIALAAGAFIPSVSIGIASVSGSLQSEEPAVAQPIAPTAETPAPAERKGGKDAKVTPPELTDEALLAQWTKDPMQTDEQIAKIFAVSRQAIGKRRNNLATAGILKKENGRVEILGYVLPGKDA